MTLLILGLLIWIAAHFFKRVAPAGRAAMQERMGDASKGVFAAAILLGLALMVIGFRGADFVYVWEPPSFFRHINNLLMLLAVALFGLGSSKSRWRGTLRHPMLTGAAVWAVAHLMVNGDLASIVLFGGILIWALAEMQLINRAEPNWERPEPGTRAGDLRLGIITFVIFVVVGLIHTLLGYPPFGG